MPSFRLAAAAVIAAVGLVQIANGVIATLIPLALDRAGAPVWSVALVVTAHAIGFLAGSYLAGSVVARLGHARAFFAFAGVAATLTLAYLLPADPLGWAIARAAIGVCLCGAYVTAESWLNHGAKSGNRGRVMGIYNVVQKLAYAGGQGMIAAGAPDATFFAIAAAAFAVAALPIQALGGTPPPASRVGRVSPWAIIRRVPSATAGCFAAGLINAPVVGMAPLFGTGVGLSEGQSVVLMAAMQIGSMVSQGPLGWVSDRIDRRWVLLGATTLTIAMSAGIALVERQSVIVLALMFAAWGSGALSIYAICVAQANDHAPRPAMVAISGTLLLLWASGSIVGPLAASAVMSWIGVGGLFVYAGALSVVLATLIAWRLHVRPPGAPGPWHVPTDRLER